MSAFADRVVTGLGPAFAERAGPLLAPLVEALVAPLAETDDDLTPTDRGWARVFDLGLTSHPALVGLATGTPVPGGLSADEERAYVRERPSWRRGTPGALRAAVQTLLTGSKQVQIVERDGSPWRLTVRVLAGQYPAGDIELLRRVVNTQKPVGIIATVVIDAGASYRHMRTLHGPTIAAERAAFPTVGAARTHEPEEGTTP